jgi:hypothetical protein
MDEKATLDEQTRSTDAEDTTTTRNSGNEEDMDDVTAEGDDTITNAQSDKDKPED